jgi:signal transduction histidine kinase
MSRRPSRSPDERLTSRRTSRARPSTPSDAPSAQRFLDDVGRVLGEALEPEAIWQRLAARVVPRLATACLVEVVAPGASEARVCAVAHADPDRTPLLAQLRARHPFIIDGEAALRGVRPGVLHSFRRAPRSILHPTLARRMGLRAALVAPLAEAEEGLAIVTLLAPAATAWESEPGKSLVARLLERAARATDNGRLRAEARRALELRDDLLRMISHDLASPIGALLLSTEALRRAVPEPRPAPASRAIETLSRAARQVQLLLSDLGALASVQRGAMPFEPLPCPLGSVLEEAVDECAQATSEKAVRITTELSGAIEVLGDRERLVQAIAGLVRQSAAAAPREGTIQILTASLPHEVRVTIVDATHGDIGDLGATSAAEPGARELRPRCSGLGLRLAKEIVEAHGGRLWTSGQPGFGSAVTFSLPRPEGADTAEAVGPREPASTSRPRSRAAWSALKRAAGAAPSLSRGR